MSSQKSFKMCFCYGMVSMFGKADMGHGGHAMQTRALQPNITTTGEIFWVRIVPWRKFFSTAEILACNMVSRHTFKIVDASHAYVVGEAFEKDALRVRTDDCVGQNDELLTGELLPSQAIMFVRHMGWIPKDLIPGSALWTVLISDKFRNVLFSRGFSGWHTYPVEVYGSNGKLLPGYHGLSITGRCGKVDESKSPIVDDGYYPTGTPRRKKLGIFFAPESWDGSDIFLADNWNFVFCSERAAEALRSSGLTNVRLTRASEYRLPL